MDDLPTVPPKQPPEEELDYIEKILPAVPIVNKKYTHPWVGYIFSMMKFSIVYTLCHIRIIRSIRVCVHSIILND